MLAVHTVTMGPNSGIVARKGHGFPRNAKPECGKAFTEKLNPHSPGIWG
jgi:hypothetical protein